MGSKEPQPAPIGPKPEPPPPLPPRAGDYIVPLQYLEQQELCRRIKTLEARVEKLQAVMDAADAFLAKPPSHMQDSRPFSQYTTAGECRQLNKAYREASEGGD